MNKLMTYIELANPKLRKEKCAIIIMSLFWNVTCSVYK